MQLMDLGLSAPMSPIRVMIEIWDLHYQLGLIVGSNLIYNMSLMAIRMVVEVQDLHH